MFIFDNTMQKCDVKINDNIFSKANFYPLNTARQDEENPEVQQGAGQDRVVYHASLLENTGF